MKISIVMEALTGRFETDTNRASRQFQRNMRNMERDAARMARRIGVVIAGATTAFAVMVRQQINVADEMGKTAQKIGVSAESLSQLQHVADISGTSFEGLQKGLLRLSRTASDSANGLATAARAFNDIGVSAQKTDGTLKDTEELLLEIADSFSRMEDGAKKAALAQELFGRAGAQLIPLLNQGRDGIEALKNEADKLGLTISGTTAKAAEAFNDNLLRLRGAAVGFVRQITAEMLPALELLSERFSDAAIESRGFREQAASGADRIVRALAFVADAAESVRRVFQIWGRSLAVTLGAMQLGVLQLADSLINGPGRALDFVIQKANNLPGIDIEFRFGLAVPQFEAQMNIARGIVREGVGDIQEILMAPLPGASFLEDLANRAARELPETLRHVTEEVGEIAAALKTADDAVEKLIAALGVQVATLGMTEAQVQLYKLGLEGATDAQLRLAESLLATIESYEKFAELQNDAASVIEANKTSAERFGDEIERLNLLVDAGVLSWAEYEKAVIRIQDAFFPVEESISQLDEFARQAARNMQTHFADFLFDPFEKGLDGMLRGFVDTLRRMLAEAAAAQLLQALFASLGSSTNPFLKSLGIAFGGSRDTGGRGYPGQAYLINPVAAPEMFIPDTVGTFVPNADRLGGSTTIFQTIVQAPEGRITRESEGRLRARDAQRSGMFASRNG